MSLVFLNGTFLPQEQAQISPMDRGFLFGDGLYEVIPFQHQKPIGLRQHLARLRDGMRELAIPSPMDDDAFIDVATALVVKNNLPSEAVAVYFQVTRGTYAKRHHGYPQEIVPTLFAYVFSLPSPPSPNTDVVKGLCVDLTADRRWQRCHIKSTSLLGNVLHYQAAAHHGRDEVILFNQHQHITEASTSNVFVVKNDIIATPPLDHQLLPGITRALVIESLLREGIAVEQKVITTDDLLAADEVWLTSASKDISPVIKVAEQLIGEGKPGRKWEEALTVFNQHKFNL